MSRRPLLCRTTAALTAVMAGAVFCGHAAAATPVGASPAGDAPAAQPAPAGSTAGAADTPSAGAAGPAEESAPREKLLQYAILYRLDARAGSGGAGERALYLGGLEGEYVGSYGRKWEFAGQVPLGSQLSSPARRMHFGSLFFLRKWRLGAPTLKFGQFVVPFSNLTTYNVHSRLIQSLYRYSLGTRIDPGVEVEGYAWGENEWQLAVTTGSGPYRLDRDGTPLVTGRISHKFDGGGNAVKLGLSAAAGTLPAYSLMTDPVSAEGGRVLRWTNKRRLAVDAEIERGIDLIRLEGAVGTDGGRGAHGLWAGWIRPLDAASSVETAVETWRQPEGAGRLWGIWVGGEHRFDGSRTARAALRWSQARETGHSDSQVSFTAQYVRQF